MAKVKVVFKFATGQSIPEGAVYLCTIKNGRMGDIHGSPKDTRDWEIEREYVWHYFLVEMAETTSDDLPF